MHLYLIFDRTLAVEELCIVSFTFCFRTDFDTGSLYLTQKLIRKYYAQRNYGRIDKCNAPMRFLHYFFFLCIILIISSLPPFLLQPCSQCN